MKLLNIGVQLRAHCCNLLCLGSIFLRRAHFCDFGSFAKLLQNILLLGFVGVKLQTERSNANVLKAFLYHFQSRHLLRHKQYASSLRQRICNQGSDGLGLASPRRTMKHEAFSTTGRLYSIKLRSICAHG